jgi:hypothetical protein
MEAWLRVSHTSRRRCARSSGRTGTSIPSSSVRIHIWPPFCQSFARVGIVVGLQYVVVVNVETRLTSAARWFKLHPLSSILTGASETASEYSRNSSTPTTAYPNPNSRTSQPHLSSPQIGTTPTKREPHSRHVEPTSRPPLQCVPTYLPTTAAPPTSADGCQPCGPCTEQAHGVLERACWP